MLLQPEAVTRKRTEGKPKAYGQNGIRAEGSNSKFFDCELAFAKATPRSSLRYEEILAL
jgi:hypothetical protein